jgi:hypothetical protein
MQWLLLIHQIPPRPAYLRAKIARRLQKLGSVAIKNSVWALPAGEQAREDLNWVLREIVEGGGDGSIVEAQLVEGLTDGGLRELFRTARDAEYDALAGEVRGLPKARRRESLEKLEKRLEEIAAVDFFAARGREPVEGLLRGLRAKIEPRKPEKKLSLQRRPEGATWVTRTGIHVDRMASAWLIRRFIDGKARFRFVSSRHHRPARGELRFDMFEGEYTHDGALCTFEVLLRRFAIDDAALRRIGEIVHDIDLKDARYDRPEKAGIEQLVNGIALSHDDDEERLARASAVFDDLYTLFKRKR